MKQWYETLFENYAETYEKEVYTQGTITEVEFIEKEIGFDKTKRILDIGCGTGRHAIELARKGYQVTGIDLSKDQLKKAQEKAKALDLSIPFLHADARELTYKEEFDIVIMLCGGSFPLMETDEMNFKILENAKNALKPGGKFIFTTLNGLFPLLNSTQDFYNQFTNTNEVKGFDLMTFREYTTLEIQDDSGNKKTIESSERYYVPSEISWLLKSLNFKNIGIFGCNIGEFDRNIPLTPKNFEMLTIAEKA